MKYFKIRDKKTGLFSVGTMSPRWSKAGKIWSSIDAIDDHIHEIRRRNKLKVAVMTPKNKKASELKNPSDILKKAMELEIFYDNAEIVQYELKETETIIIKQFVEK